MEEIDVDDLVIRVRKELNWNPRTCFEDETNTPPESVLSRAEKLRQKQERQWKTLVESALHQMGYVETFVEVPHRPDVDLYYKKGQKDRYYLLRNHISDTPWQDAFNVLKKVLKKEMVLPNQPVPTTRIGRILSNV